MLQVRRARSTHRVVHVKPLRGRAVHELAVNEQLSGGLGGRRRMNRHSTRGVRRCAQSRAPHEEARTTHRLRAVRPQQHAALTNRTLIQT